MNILIQSYILAALVIIALALVVIATKKHS